MIYDFVVVGSGVSGGRIAYELTKGGAKCLLLEAGKEFKASTFPSAEIDYSTQLFWGGGLEVSTDARMGFLRAKCLGGTSIVNQALLDRFDSIAWEDWQYYSESSDLNALTMEPHYLACSKDLSISQVPQEHYNKNTRKFIEAFDQNGYGWKALERGQKDCKLDHGSDCIVCLGGCPRNSKQSSLITSISEARKLGLEVLSEVEVHSLRTLSDSVEIKAHYQKKEERIFRANRLVLAAGALGNTAILFRSNLQNRLPALGKGFCCHPQFMTFAYFDETIDAHKGAFQAVKSNDPNLRKAGLKLENVFAQPIGTAMLLPGAGQKHLELMEKYRNFASLEVAIRDEAVGVIEPKGDTIRIKKQLTQLDQEKAKSGLALVEELFESLKPKAIIRSNQIFGLHLMGGCSIGTNGHRSVVNPDFHVHGFERISIADSSIFPVAPGINPSFTIMALSHRASQKILSER